MVLKQLNCIILPLLLALPLFFRGQFQQVLIANKSQGSELSIAINPAKPREVLAASSSGFYASDNDTGRTWHKSGFSCRRFDLYQDPLALWLDQDVCYSHVSPQDTNVMSVTYYNSAQIFQSDCYRMKLSQDKVIEHLRLHCEPASHNQHKVWTQLDKPGSKDSRDSSFIMYAFSSYRGWGWDKLMRISVEGGNCSKGDSTLMGATCCTGPNREVYAAWAGPKGLMFRNLSDTNTHSEKAIFPMKNGWLYSVGKYTSNGLPTMACDLSPGEHRGRLYVCWSDERHGPHNKNVFLSYSDDQGENWTEPIVVTYRPNHKEQFMPFMTIDQSNGTLYILYYDQQNFVAGDLADLYLAQSKNGGLKFDYYRVNTTAIKPHPTWSYGKCLALSAVNGIVRPIWMQSDKKGQVNIYTALIDEAALKAYNKNYSEKILIQKTFTWSPKIKIDFTLKNSSTISAIITKPLEAGFEKTVVKNKKMSKGRNSLVVDTKKLGLQKGNYTLTLYYKHGNTFVWIIEE